MNDVFNLVLNSLNLIFAVYFMFDVICRIMIEEKLFIRTKANLTDLFAVFFAIVRYYMFYF